jgi:hypothetical protein
MTLVRLIAALPAELALNALVTYWEPAYLVSVALLAISSTILVIWVAEPATMRALRKWVHAPSSAAARRLHAAEALWRVRATVPDRPGSLQRLTHGFAEQDLNVLTVHVHALADRVLDEFVLAAPPHVPAEDILRAVTGAGGADVQVWPTTALALADGQTWALTLAARVTADPGELPMALAELLGARIVPAPDPAAVDGPAPDAPGGSSLRVHAPGGGTVVLDRPGEPFTPAEVARAHRLAEVVGAVHALRPSHTAAGT